MGFGRLCYWGTLAFYTSRFVCHFLCMVPFYLLGVVLTESYVLEGFCGWYPPSNHHRKADGRVLEDYVPSKKLFLLHIQVFVLFLH